MDNIDELYLNLSKELQKKQLIERIELELNYLFIMRGYNQVSLNDLISSVEGLEIFTIEELDKAIKEAINNFNSKDKVKLTYKENKITIGNNHR